MRIREFFYWLTWGLLFVGIIISGPLSMYGCYSATERPSSTESPAKKEQSKQAAAREKYEFEMIYFDWRGVYLIKLQGHDYLRAGDFILHTASCKGAHTLLSP